MKNRKAIILILLVLVMSLLTTACTERENDNLGATIGEKELDEALDEDVETDEFENEDESFDLSDSLDWPSDKMHTLPKPNAKIISVTDQADDGSTTVTVHYPNKKESIDYLQKVKDLGFIEGSVSISDDYSSYMGYGTDNSQIVVDTNGLDEDIPFGVITFIKDSVYAIEYFKKVEAGEPVFDTTGVDMTDQMPWPKDQMDKIPELEGKIIGVNSSNESVTIELEYVKREDVLSFIEAIRKLGFDASFSRAITPDNILYMSRDDKDYGLSIRWFGTGANINYTLP